MEMEKVVQALALQVFTAALDVAQQVEPVADMDALETRAQAILRDTAVILVGLTPEQIEQIETGQAPLHLHLDWPEATYDEVAVGAAVQLRLQGALKWTCALDIDGYALVQGVARYMAVVDAHKLGYLMENAANLIVIAAGA